MKVSASDSFAVSSLTISSCLTAKPEWLVTATDFEEHSTCSCVEQAMRGGMRASTVLFLLLASTRAFGYSVLAHESLVDSEWKRSVAPAIKQRFPGISDEQLMNARAYAYGGCIIQDLGYYPFSSHLFSDLVHYVRSGDFVENLIKDSQTPEEYGFALGALSHYAADNYGHPATNHSVALLYPKKRAKFGDSITFAQYPTGHLQTEFSFDVVQVAKGRYASEAFHSFIGFEVADKLLARAFEETYGLPLKDVLPNIDMSIGTYRWTVGSLLPQMTKVALASHQKDFEKNNLFRYSRAEYEKNFGRSYYRPGWFSRFLAAIFRIMPNFGPFKALHFRAPTPQVESLFLASQKDSNTHYLEYLSEVREHGLDLRNTNLDDGKAVSPGEYSFTDKTYAKLAQKLAEHPEDLNSKVRENILSFYARPQTPPSSKHDREEWTKTLAAVEKIKAVTQVPAVKSE